ncbi:MAG: SUMF1/EgtB/PvdO family nonheme iron enzyme [Phycisphaerales bacterium]
MDMNTRTTQSLLTLALFCATPLRASAQPVPSYDFQWATIGSPGNATCPIVPPDPIPLDITRNRGRVDYEYRISKLEITTTQWVDFINAFEDADPTLLPPGARFVHGPFHMGAILDPNDTTGIGRRLVNPNIPNAAILPVTGTTWEEAALYVNWLHNGKSADPRSLWDGAYDVTTWTRNDDGSFNHGARRPDAKFWIPTLDEWVKAGYYDPDRYGADQGGWWLYPNRSDAPMIAGFPGSGAQTSATMDIFGGALGIPLGAYSDQVSPWGLLDVSGGRYEWMDTWFHPGFDPDGPYDPRNISKCFAASGLDVLPYESYNGAVYHIGSDVPMYFGMASFRIAGAIPSPATALIVAMGADVLRRRRV